MPPRRAAGGPPGEAPGRPPRHTAAPALVARPARSPQRYSLTLEEGLRVQVGVQLQEGALVDPGLQRDLSEGVARVDDPDALAHRLAADLADVGLAALAVVPAPRVPGRGQDDHNDQDQARDQ